MKCSLFAIGFFAILGSFVLVPLAISKPATSHAQLDNSFSGSMQASLK